MRFPMGQGMTLIILYGFRRQRFQSHRVTEALSQGKPT
jgi:hypothetical protein